MARRPNRLSEPGNLHPVFLAALGALAVVLLGLLVVIASFTLGESGPSWPVLIGGLVLLLVLSGALVAASALRGRGSSRVDDRARYMATPKDLLSLQEPAQRHTSQRLGTEDVGLGVPIGTMVHGNGAHLDNLETHDTRPLLANTCTSMEPGIYLPQEGLGLRTEVDVLLLPGGIEVTGAPAQTEVTPLLG